MIDQLDAATVAVEVCAAFGRILGTDMAPQDDFFALGGTSLTSMLVLGDLQERLDLKLTPAAVLEHPTAEALAAAICTHSVLEPDAVKETTQAVAESAPASVVQRAELLLAILAASRGYLYWVYQLNGRLDPEALRLAFDEVVERHEILRVKIEGSGHGPNVSQVIRPFTAGGLRIIDLIDRAKIDGLNEAIAATKAIFQTLSPYVDPGLQGVLYVIDSKTHVLALFVAETLVDGESGALVAAELSRAYAARVGTEASPLPFPTDDSFVEYVAANPVSASIEERAREHWRRIAERVPAVLAWSRDRRDDVTITTFDLSKKQWTELTALARKLKTTPYTIVLASYGVALARVIDAPHVQVTGAVSDRSDPKTEYMIGSFTSIVRIESRVEPDDRFLDVIERTSAAVREAVAHCAVPAPIAETEAGAPHRKPGVEFYMFENREGLALPGLRRRRFRLHSTREALTLNCTPTPFETQRFTFSSATADEAELAVVARAVRAVLTAAMAAPETPVASIDHVVEEPIGPVADVDNDTDSDAPAIEEPRS